MNRDPIFRLFEALNPATGPDDVGSETGDHRPMDHAEQLAAMDADLRRLLTGIQAAQFLPHDLTETVGINQFPHTDTCSVETGLQPEIGQHRHGMRQHVDANPEFTNLADAFEDLDLDPGFVELKRGRQSADAGACDECLHDWLLPPVSRRAKPQAATIYCGVTRLLYSSCTATKLAVFSR